MKVYKIFIRMTKANYKIMLLSLGIFMLLTMATSFSNQSTLNSKPSVLLVNENSDEHSILLSNFIESISEVKTESDYDGDLRDALFYKEVDVIIEIPENFSDTFLDGNPKLIVTPVRKDLNTSMFSLDIENYLRILHQNTLLFPEYDQHKLQKESMVLFEDQISPRLINFEENPNLLSKGLFSATIYPLLFSAFSVIISIINSIFNTNIKNRMFSAPLTLKSLLFETLLGSYTVMSIFFIIQLVIIQAMGYNLFVIDNFLYILNMYLFTISSSTLAVAIGIFVFDKSKNVGPIISNSIALPTSFLCGVFIPLEIIPASVTAFSQFLPAYWSVYANGLIQDSGGIFNADIQKAFLIQGLYIIIFFGLTLLAFKKTQQTEA